MKFIARKNNKEKVIYTDNFYLVEKTKLKNPTRVLTAWKKRKNELRKEGWDIHVVDTSTTKRASPENTEDKPKKKVTVFKMFGRTFIENEESI